MQIEIMNPAVLFVKPLKSYVRRYSPSLLENIQNIALKVLTHSPLILCSVLLPFTSVIASISSAAGCKIISDGNIAAFKKQYAKGLDADSCQRMIQSIKMTLELNAICHSWLYISCSFFGLSTLPVLGFSVSIIPPRGDFFKVAEKQRAVLSSLQQAENAYLNAQELNQLKTEYPLIETKSLQEKCGEELRLRHVKSEYHKIQKKWMALGWKKMLLSGKYTMAQGFDGDVEIFTPLCHLAVTAELDETLTLKEGNCPPTLYGHLQKLKQVKSQYQQLSIEKKAKLQQILLTADYDKDVELKEVCLKISDIGSHLLQSQDLFRYPLLMGAERFCIKKRLFVPFFKIQLMKCKNYRDGLFFRN
jgi:hypothetical protein